MHSLQMARSKSAASLRRHR